MGLKDNFYQALRELLNGGGAAGSEPEDKELTQADFEDSENPIDSFAQSTNEAPGKSFADFMPQDEEPDFPQPAVPPELETESDRGAAKPKSNFFGRPSRPEVNNTPRPQQAQPSGFDPNEPLVTTGPDEMTVISKSTVVLGDIRSLANVTVDGKVRGNINVLKDATMHGVLVGNLMCNNSNMRGSSVQGDVTAKGRTIIDNDSMLLGDMKAQFSNVDGKVKGNMDIGSKIHIHQNAVVAGNINTNTIAVEDGANIKGFVNTSFLDENGDTAFPNQVAFGNDGADE